MKHADYVVEYAKTFINLATLLLGLSITFASKLSAADAISQVILLSSWLCWIISVYFGAQAIREMVNVAYRTESEPDDETDAATDHEDTIFSSKITASLNLQFWLFGVGFLIAVIGALRIAGVSS